MADVNELRRRLAETGWDAHTLVEKLGELHYAISALTASRWITGLAAPQQSALPFLARALGCEVSDLETQKAEAR